MSETQDESFEELMERTQRVMELAKRHEAAYDGIICPMCGEALTAEQKDDPEAIYREVVSWVTGPKLQSPVLRGQTGRIAHAACVRKCVEGQAADQESIPGLESDELPLDEHVRNGL